MERVIKRITNWLVENGAISNTDQELYEYAIYSIFITISPLFLVLLIGIFMGTFLKGVIFIIPFMCIRKFCGGYHAKNSGVCFFCSCGILVICMYVVAHFKYEWWVSVTTTICVLSLNLNSPIDSENKRLDKDEKRHYKKITMGLSSLFYVSHCIFLFLGQKEIALCLAVGICLTASLQVPCVIKSLKQKYEGTAV